MGGWVCLSAPNNKHALLLCGLPWCSSLQVWVWVCFTESVAFVLVSHSILYETIFSLIRPNHTLFFRHIFSSSLVSVFVKCVNARPCHLLGWRYQVSMLITTTVKFQQMLCRIYSDVMKSFKL